MAWKQNFLHQLIMLLKFRFIPATTNIKGTQADLGVDRQIVRD